MLSVMLHTCIKCVAKSKSMKVRPNIAARRFAPLSTNLSLSLNDSFKKSAIMKSGEESFLIKSLTIKSTIANAIIKTSSKQRYATTNEDTKNDVSLETFESICLKLIGHE